MKADELKARICSFLEDMIDSYYSTVAVGERLLNYTLKVIVKTNISKLDSIFNLFTDANGEIDAHQLINEYVNQMGNERITFDLRDYVDNDIVKSMLPNKALVISGSDIARILNNC